MSNCNITRFRAVHRKTVVPLSLSRRWKNGYRRTLSTSTITHFSQNTSPTVRAPTSIVLAMNLTPFDAPQRSDEWFALRRNKLTTSTFSTALGFWKGKRRSELWHEKVFASEAKVVEYKIRSAMEWGVLNEAAAIEQYRNITGREVSSLGFAVHAKEQYDWLGASPDGLLGDFPGGGILEVKCPYNRGKPEIALPWSTVPFYYMPQVQGQMEIMDRDWVDLYCWTPNGSTIFRVIRERGYWDLIHGILREFWWGNVMPARDALSSGKEEVAKTYEPASTHKQTGLAISRSIKLASESKMLCRDIAAFNIFCSKNTCWGLAKPGSFGALKISQKPINDEVCKSLKQWRYSVSALKLKQEVLYCLFDQIIHSAENVDIVELFKHLHPKVLAPGGAKDPVEILSEFLGREPSIQAFIDNKIQCSLRQ